MGEAVVRQALAGGIAHTRGELEGAWVPGRRANA